MKKHMKSQHDGKTAEFKCHHCGEIMNSARNLTRHMNNKHEKLFDTPVIIGSVYFKKSYTLNTILKSSILLP